MDVFLEIISKDKISKDLLLWHSVIGRVQIRSLEVAGLVIYVFISVNITIAPKR